MAEADAAWTFVGSSIEGERLEIGGLNVWDYRWVSLPGQVAHVRDPLYGQPFAFAVYELAAEAKTVRFAAGEFSNGVYGFYVLREP